MLAGKIKGICCRTWLEMDLFCSLQRVWKAEIIITGHKGQRNKSGKSRRAHGGEQRGGKNSPLVPLCNGVDTQGRWHKRHLDIGPANEIKEENNCKDFGNRAVPIKGQSHRPLMPVQGHFATGFLEQWYAGSQMQSKLSISPLIVAEHHHGKHKGNGTWSTLPPTSFLPEIRQSWLSQITVSLLLLAKEPEQHQNNQSRSTTP